MGLALGGIRGEEAIVFLINIQGPSNISLGGVEARVLLSHVVNNFIFKILELFALSISVSVGQNAKRFLILYLDLFVSIFWREVRRSRSLTVVRNLNPRLENRIGLSS